jgi:hypothetical protein
MVPEVCISLPLVHHPREQEAGILEVLRYCPSGMDPGREECMAHLHAAVEAKGLPETHLRLASSHTSSQWDIVDHTLPPRTRAEAAGAVQRWCHLADQLADEQAFQDRPDH